MKLIKEHITHFTEDSDPIRDMDIGMDKIIKDWIEAETKYSYHYINNKKQWLWICAKYGKTEFVKYLLDKGHDVHVGNDAALVLASSNGHVEVIKLLLDAGADVHAEGEYPLRTAAYHGYAEAVKLLLDAGADVHVDDDHTLKVAKHYRQDDVIKVIQDHIDKEVKEKTPNIKRKHVKESVTHFVEDSDPVHDMGIGMNKVIKDWIENETSRQYNKENLLVICANCGKVDFVKYLLDNGYDVHYENDLALRTASENDYIEIVKLLLDAGADVHALNNYALRRASANSHVEIVKLLLDAGANVHGRDDYALRHASENNHIEILKILLKAGADVHALNDYALRWASEKGYVEIVKILLDAGADVNVQYSEPLHLSVKHGHDKVVKLLLDAGVNVDVHDNDYKSALRCARKRGFNDVVKLLQDYNKKEKRFKVPNIKRKYVKESVTHFVEDSDPVHDMGVGMDVAIMHWLENETEYENNKRRKKDLLWIAAEYGRVDFVKYLLSKGYDIHINEDLPLRVASARGHTEVVKILLDAGADIHASSNFDDDALGLAYRNGQIKVIKVLKDHIAKEKQKLKESVTYFKQNSDPIEDMDIGIDTAIKKWIINNTDYKYELAISGEHLLWICAEAGKTEFVRHLLRKGYTIHKNDDFALRQAAENGHTEIVKMLIDAGADVHAYDEYSLRWAVSKGYTEIVKLLIDAGANVHIHNDVVLCRASELGRPEIVKLLLDAGADVHADNDYPLKVARRNGYPEVVKIIQNHIDKENKVVKESITHFREDSDPVQDMNIGIEGLYNEWLNDIFEWAPHIKDALRALEMGKEPPYLNRRIKEIELIIKYGDNNAEVFLKYFLKKYDIPVTFNNNYFLRVAADYDEFKLAKKLIDWGANIDNALGYAKIFQRSTKAADNLELIKRDLDEENS